jgi:hypothetical protein
LVWLLPLTVVLILSLYILYLLKTRLHRKNLRKKGILNVLLEPESRFSFIIISYLLQWSVPAVYIIFEPYLGYYFEALTLALKWPSYTVIFKFIYFLFLKIILDFLLKFKVCLTDPIIALVLNSNVRFFRKKNISHAGHISVCNSF